MLFFRRKKKDTKAIHIHRARVELAKLNELILETQESINGNCKPDTTEILYESIRRKVFGKEFREDETKILFRGNGNSPDNGVL